MSRLDELAKEYRDIHFEVQRIEWEESVLTRRLAELKESKAEFVGKWKSVQNAMNAEILDPSEVEEEVNK